MITNLTQATPGGRRRTRSPKHPYQVHHIPYHIQPFFIAPVLPGETMKNLMFQDRVVTQPIKNPLIGWWIEYYFFYVKLSDLYEREELREMVLNPAWSPADVITAQGGSVYTIADGPAHFYGGGASQINFSILCYRRIVDEYFRDEDETFADHKFVDSAGRSLSCAQLVGNSVLDSVSLADDETAVDVDLDAITGGAGLLASDVEAGMRLWHQQRLYGITELSYEDWLAQFGVKPQIEETHRPELIRYVREWSYPTNTIDPSNGTPRSAVSWTIQERADKARAFREPGFLYGVTVCRPKVYIRQHEGSFTQLLNNYRAWLPPLAQGNPEWSRMKLAHDQGPLHNVVADTDGWVVDLRDLFLYGEQFINFNDFPTAAGSPPWGGMLNTVNAGLTNVRYPLDLATIDALFVTSGANYVKHDGIVDLSIACAPLNPLVDLSPRGGNRSNIVSGGF